MSTFLVLRYVAFAFVILFSSVICVVAALNLGSLQAASRLSIVDTYLIFLGAFGLVVVFPVLFVELFRRHAFISRVAAEVTWVALLWVMHLSGASAITAIAPDLTCSPGGPDTPIECASTRALVAFTWLCTITLLSYLLGLVICAAHHHEHGRVWTSGVRDYPWFARRVLPDTPVRVSASYGKIVDPADAVRAAPPQVYAQQLGLAPSYAVEPLPALPVPAAAAPSRRAASLPPLLIPGTTAAAAAPAPAAAASSISAPPSLYPQHLQSTAGRLPALLPPGRVSGSTPPPAGAWPRPRPQEPLPPKSRRSALPPASAPAAPEMAQRAATAPSAATPPSSGAARPRPAGARTPPSQRSRPPPLDLSRITLSEEPRRQ